MKNKTLLNLVYGAIFHIYCITWLLRGSNKTLHICLKHNKQCKTIRIHNVEYLNLPFSFVMFSDRPVKKEFCN